MYNSLLTIDNMFVAAAGAAPVLSRPNAAKKAAQIPPTSEDNPPPVNIPEATTTDNTSTSTKNELVNKPPQEFRHTLRKKTMAEQPQKVQDSHESKEPGPTSNIAEQPNVVQSWLEQYSQTVEHGKGRVTTKIQPKVGYELAQLLANFKADKSTPVTGQAAKAAEIKLLLSSVDKGQLGLKTVLPDTSKGQLGLKTVLPDTSKGQLGLKTVLPDTSNGQLGLKTVLPDTSNGQLGPKTVLPDTPKSTPTTDTQLGEGKNADKILIQNKTLVLTETADSGENSKGLIHEASLDSNSKATTTGEKTAMTDMSAVSDSQKTPSLNTDLPPVQDKSSQPQSELVGISPVKFAPTAEKPTDSKASAGQQGYVLSESSDSNGKEQSGNLSGDSTFQKLNVTEVQISTGQTKDRGNSTSNNGSNSNLEQILSHNNPQTPITEQSSASAGTPKTANPSGQTLPSDVSAGIGKQILESIHSSLSQQSQNQQITVRLNPPELGKVFIKFQEQDAQITGLLEVSKTQTRYEIEQALPQIIRNLTDCGIQIKRLEVVLPDGQQSEQQTLKDQSLQNGWTQQQDSANPGAGANSPNTGEINEWLTNDNSYQNISELQEALVTNGSINMLM
ncbi:MAG: flagellar hook-length control protein FliK [Planctomycetota bacterium]|jgi:flagellar hook-length control protein FliK